MALIYLGIFLVSAIIGGSLIEPSPSNQSENLTGIESDTTKNERTKTQNSTFISETEDDSNTKEKKEINKIPDLLAGSEFKVKHGDGEIEFNLEDIKINRIPNDGRNLVITVKIKNKSNSKFFISDSGWKLLDSENVEVEESGIYEPVFSDFAPGTFFFTIVEPNVGKKEIVGYSIKNEPYYLTIDGKIVGRINNTK